MSIVVIDYGMGNLGSVRRSIEDQGVDVVVSSDPNLVRSADGLVLPGVGSFAVGMSHLNSTGLSDAIRDAVSTGCPLLGICLGMQLLASEGFEGGQTKGLDIVPGGVLRLSPADPSVRIPHVGWNEAHFRNPSPLFEGIDDRSDFYFVHSYEFKVREECDVVATTPYGSDVVTVVNRGNVFGTQFHPEKSSRCGARLLNNFLKVAQVLC